MKDETGKIAKATLLMSTLTTFSRITGFLRVMAFAFALGLTRTIIPDAFNLANSLPNIIYELFVGGILSSLFIPVFVEYLTTKDKDAAWELASNILNIALFFLTLLTLVGIVASPWIIKLYTLRLPIGSEKPLLMTFFLKIFVPQIIFYGLLAIFTGILNSNRKFGPPAFAPILNNLIVITTFLLFRFLPDFGVTGLAVGTTLGVVSMALTQLPFIFKTGFRYRLSFNLKHPGVKKIGRLALPVLGYVLINQVGIWVVSNLAAPIKGGYAAYTLAFQTFYQLPIGIFAVSVTSAIFPALSEHHLKKEYQKFKEALSLGLRLIAFIVIPAAAGYLAISPEIIGLTLEYGMFGSQDTALLGSVIRYFSLGLFFFASYTFFTRAFYSLQDTRTPMIINGVTVFFNIIINLFLFGFLKVQGLALGHSLAYILATFLSFLVLRKRLQGIGGKIIILSLLKVGVAASFSGLTAFGVVKLFTSFLNFESLGFKFLQVLAAISVGILTYLLLAKILKIEELTLFKKTFFPPPRQQLKAKAKS